MSQSLSPHGQSGKSQTVCHTNARRVIQLPRKEWPSKARARQGGRLWDELVRERTQVEARLQTRLGDPTVEGLSYVVGSFFNERAIWVTRCPYSHAAAA